MRLDTPAVVHERYDSALPACPAALPFCAPDSPPTAETVSGLRPVATALSDDELLNCQNRAFLRSLAFFGSSVFNGDAAECSSFRSSLVKFT